MDLRFCEGDNVFDLHINISDKHLLVLFILSVCNKRNLIKKGT